MRDKGCIPKKLVKELNAKRQTVPSVDDIDDGAQVLLCEIGADCDVRWQTKSGKMHFFTALDLLNGVFDYYCPGYHLEISPDQRSLKIVRNPEDYYE